MPADPPRNVDEHFNEIYARLRRLERNTLSIQQGETDPCCIDAGCWAYIRDDVDLGNSFLGPGSVWQYFPWTHIKEDHGVTLHDGGIRVEPGYAGVYHVFFHIEFGGSIQGFRSLGLYQFLPLLADVRDRFQVGPWPMDANGTLAMSVSGLAWVYDGDIFGLQAGGHRASNGIVYARGGPSGLSTCFKLQRIGDLPAPQPN